MEADDEHNLHERAFHSAVREYLVCLLLFFLMYGFSYLIVKSLRKHTDTDDLYSGEESDALVYRISIWICTFSLSVSIGAVMLLPFSIFSNEILLLYPNSYYMQWLNISLVHSLWNYIFLLSNSCLFILLPFAFFFLESQGLCGLPKGVMTRVYESVIVSALLIVVIACLGRLSSIFLQQDSLRMNSLFDDWSYTLPYTYSCVSLFGVVMLLACTPLGFARLFTFVGSFLLKPKSPIMTQSGFENGSVSPIVNGYKFRSELSYANGSGYYYARNRTKSALIRTAYELGVQQLDWIYRLKYWFIMLLLLSLTVISVVMVMNNAFQLLFGFRSLPSHTENVQLGSASLSALGIFGAVIQVAVIFYLMAASLVGFYCVPWLQRLKPAIKQTSMAKIVANCAVVIVLSCALPVLSRSLGITNFDLLGNFGRMNWLSNFSLVWWYNLAFVVSTAITLATILKGALGKEFSRTFHRIFPRKLRRTHSAS